MQADKYKLLISDSLKNEKYWDAFKYIQKLEALKVKVPDSIMYFKGESSSHLLPKYWDGAKEALEKYLNKTGTAGKYYREALVLLGKLEKDIVLDEKQKRRYGTPLNYAVHKGILFKVKDILNRKLYSVNAEGHTGYKAIHYAASSVNENNTLIEILRLLIEAGANVNTLTGGDGKHGYYTPLDYATSGWGDPEAAAFLKKHGAKTAAELKKSTK